MSFFCNLASYDDVKTNADDILGRSTEPAARGYRRRGAAVHGRPMTSRCSRNGLQTAASPERVVTSVRRNESMRGKLVIL
jgi:hypothetical protein